MNQFEELCKLASDENWCWKLSCATCGHMHFRAAFLALSEGLSPADDEWIIHSGINSSKLESKQIPRSYTEAQLNSVLLICQKADLKQIASNCKFPNCLGYLGLVLEDLITYLPAYRDLSISWASQLKDIIKPGTDAHLRLNDIIETNRTLTIEDLEMCEPSMRSEFRG